MFARVTSVLSWGISALAVLVASPSTCGAKVRAVESKNVDEISLILSPEMRMELGRIQRKSERVSRVQVVAQQQRGTPEKPHIQPDRQFGGYSQN